jgi:hypothetical protein
MVEFDPQDVLGTTVTNDEFEGKKTLTPEGHYAACTVTDVQAFEPHEDKIKEGAIARLLVTFSCPTQDLELKHYITMMKEKKPKSAFMRITKAMFPDKAVAMTKSPRDWIGQTVDLYATHENGAFGEWCDMKFTAVK